MNNLIEVIEVADTKNLAKFIRLWLKNKYPKIKFSVRSEYFSMGSSVEIRFSRSNPYGLSKESLYDELNGFSRISFDMTDTKIYLPPIIVTLNNNQYKIKNTAYIGVEYDMKKEQTI